MLGFCGDFLLIQENTGEYIPLHRDTIIVINPDLLKCFDTTNIKTEFILTTLGATYYANDGIISMFLQLEFQYGPIPDTPS